MAYYRKTAKGWRVEIERAGVRESGSFTSKSAAQQWATAREAEIQAGKRSRWPRKTLSDALDRYVLKVSAAKRGHRAEGLRIEAIRRDFPALCARVLSEIDVTHLAEWRDQRLRVVTPGSVLRDINLLRHVWSLASTEWAWTPAPTPWKALRMPADNPPRDRRMSWREIRRLLRRCDFRTGQAPVGSMQGVGWALLVSLRTAMRAGELIGMTSGTVDLRRRVVTLATHKTVERVGKREVPLTPQAVRLLRVLVEAHPAGQLLPVSLASLDPLFRKARDHCLLHDVHFHDARATALTLLSRRVDVLTLAKISGHRDLRVLLRSYYRETAEEISGRLASGRPGHRSAPSAGAEGLQR